MGIIEELAAIDHEDKDVDQKEAKDDENPSVESKLLKDWNLSQLEDKWKTVKCEDFI